MPALLWTLMTGLLEISPFAATARQFADQWSGERITGDFYLEK